MLQPLVSVIIPAHNGQNYLAEAIDSILKQTYTHFEILVIDNGSTDQTADIAKSFHQVNYIRSEIADTAIARNQGLSLAKGEFIAFLDQDDLWSHEKLEKQLHFLSCNPQFGAVIGMQQMFLENRNEKPHWLKASLLEKPQLAYLPSALLARKETFVLNGNFNTALPLASDVAWFFKAKHEGIQIGVLDEVFVFRRIHSDNTSKKCELLQKEILAAIQLSLKQRRK